MSPSRPASEIRCVLCETARPGNGRPRGPLTCRSCGERAVVSTIRFDRLLLIVIPPLDDAGLWVDHRQFLWTRDATDALPAGDGFLLDLSLLRGNARDRDDALDVFESIARLMLLASRRQALPAVITSFPEIATLFDLTRLSRVATPFATWADAEGWLRSFLDEVSIDRLMESSAGDRD